MKQAPKNRAGYSAGTKAKYAAAAISLAIGFLAIGAAHWFFGLLAKPNLEVRLIVPAPGRVVVRLVNTGTDDLVLDLDNVRCFLVPVPRKPHEYAVHIRSEPDASRQAAFRGFTLRPGDGVDVKNVLPLLKKLGETKVVISAIYSVPEDSPPCRGCWRGFARSLPLEVTMG